MADAKKKYVSGPKFTTPRSAAIWPRLNEPDTKHNAEGVYECKQELPLDNEIVQKIKAKAMELAQAEYDKQRELQPDALTDEEYDEKVAELKAAGKQALIKKLKVIRLVEPLPEEVDEDGDGTGTVFLKAKMKASGTYKTGPKTGQRWERTPDVFDRKGVTLKRPPAIGGGSEVKMSIELSPYYVAGTGDVGCSFRLNAVQLLTLVQFGQRDASAHGFGSEDGDDIDEAGDEFGGGNAGGSDEADDDEL